MRRIIVDNVAVYADDILTEGFIMEIVAEEKILMEKRKKKLGLVEILLVSEDEVEVIAKTKAEIKRLRRITGYLSDINNFNVAKKSELNDRVVHFL